MLNPILIFPLYYYLKCNFRVWNMKNLDPGMTSLLIALSTLAETVNNDPNNAVEAARNVFVQTDELPLEWMAAIEVGFGRADEDANVTTEEAMAVIDAASKATLVLSHGLDPHTFDTTPFEQLVVNDAVLLLNAETLAENQRILDANQRILDSGSGAELQDIANIRPLPFG